MNNKLILVVDDEPLNLKMIRAMLSREGCRILEARNGNEALLKVKENPDLILMDIMMPELNGFETCAIIKEDEAGKAIPIIFLSALQDLKTKVTGLDLGGVDYISKPFQSEELLARVRTHLTIREQELKLQEYAVRLEEMVEERTRQLIHADRLATLGTLVAAVVHEINNPLAAILGNTEITQLELDKLKAAQSGPVNDSLPDWINTQTCRVEQGLTAIFQGSLSLRAIIRRLKDFGKREISPLDHFALVLPVQDALEIMRPRLKSSVPVEVKIHPDVKIRGNRQEISQVFINLIHNSVDALDGEEGRITISAETDNRHHVIIHFKDSGQGIPENIIGQLFTPFFTTKRELDGTGLGLFIIQQILEKHQGTIEAVLHKGPGAWFRMSLPRSAEGF